MLTVNNLYSNLLTTDEYPAAFNILYTRLTDEIGIQCYKMGSNAEQTANIAVASLPISRTMHLAIFIDTDQESWGRVDEDGQNLSEEDESITIVVEFLDVLSPL